MNCPNCGGPVSQGDAFCGKCGAQMGQQAAAQPTQQIPQQPASQQPTQQMPAAQAPQAAAQQPTQQWQQQGAQPPPPPSGGGKTVVVVIVILILLGLCACTAIGGWYWYAYISAADEILETLDDPVVVPETPETATEASNGYTSAEEALLSELPTDWVYELAADSPELAEYWAGPPESEWMSVYVVQRDADGAWYVAESYEYSYGFDDEAATDVTDADIARVLVEDFLGAIMADMPLEAQKLTVEPFSNDPASAQYSNGDFKSYYVEEVVAEGDGTYWVIVSEEWTWGTDRIQYHVVPTEAGWRINDLVLLY